MQIDALVYQPVSRAALRSVIPRSYQPGSPARLHFAEDWAEFLARAEEGITQVGVVDPAIDTAVVSHEQLLRLRRLLGEARIILYFNRDTLDPGLREALGMLGYRLILTQGVDDDRASLENALAAAASRTLLDRAREHLEDHFPPPALDLFLATVSGWSPGIDGEGLAKGLAMDSEELRRSLAEGALPLPRECLGWGCLFFALGMAEIHRETVSRLAYRVGYGDRSSLCRLCRRLTHLPATELFAPGGREAAVAALEKRLVG
jgi:hypothetical protein